MSWLTISQGLHRKPGTQSVASGSLSSRTRLVARTIGFSGGFLRGLTSLACWVDLGVSRGLTFACLALAAGIIQQLYPRLKDLGKGVGIG